MGIYDRPRVAYTNALSSFAEDRRLVVADSPTDITRERKVFADKTRAPQTSVVGPYTVRIEPFRTTRNAVTFDEKGTVATLAFVLVGVDIPATQQNGEATFKLDDTIKDGQGNTYRVTTPPRYVSGTVELNVELVG